MTWRRAFGGHLLPAHITLRAGSAGMEPLCLPKHRMRLLGWLAPFLPAVTAHRWLQPGTGGGSRRSPGLLRMSRCPEPSWEGRAGLGMGLCRYTADPTCCFALVMGQHVCTAAFSLEISHAGFLWQLLFPELEVSWPAGTTTFCPVPLCSWTLTDGPIEFPHFLWSTLEAEHIAIPLFMVSLFPVSIPCSYSR